MISSMKKLILVIILLGAVTYLGMNIYNNNIDNSSQSAQALSTNPAFQITYNSKKISIDNKKTAVYAYTVFKVKASQKTAVTFLPPKILKDGQPFTLATSSYRFDVAPMIRSFVTRPGKFVKGPVVEFKKGKGDYMFYLSFGKAALPVGTYTVTFGDYMIGTSTVVTPIGAPWSKTFAVTNSIASFLNGLNYKLTSVNNIAIPSSSSTPLLAFKDGRVRIRICNLMEGSYAVKDDALTISDLAGTLMACNDATLTTIERSFSEIAKNKLKLTLVGETLVIKSDKGNVTFTFTKYTPSTLAATAVPKVYPCNFVGPIEENAVRDCSGTLGTTLPPTITAVSTSSTRIGQTVTITGTNFAATNNIVLMDNLTDDFTSALPVATATPTGNTISFVIPSTHTCPQIDSTITTTCNQRSITSGVHSVQVKTSAGTSNSLSFTINP